MALCVFFLSVFTFSHVHNVVIADVASAVLDRQTGTLSLLPGFKNDFVAWANFTDDITNTGWAYLEVITSSQYNDSLQAYAAGAVEAAVTSPLIGKHWMNTMKGYCDGKNDDGYCKRLRDYILANLQWMEEQMDKGEDLEYWHQIHLALLQLKGLEDRYNGKVDFPIGHFSINPFGLLLFQMSGDLEDLEAALNKTVQSKLQGSGSCSALIKLLPGNKELLVAHDTWSSYQSMLRIMKKYSFAYKRSPKDGTPIPGGIQAFSSYPGTIFSGDDFYILSSGIVVLETTIGNSNPALWKFVIPRWAVMEWLRNIVANRLAESGDQWAAHFSKYNSGTYNNQWMIVDYNHFTPGKTDMEDGLLTVLEQIPGLIVSSDKTKELLQNGYWASYNIPYYEDIFNISGCPELVKKYGDWFSFDMNPRAQIFRRNQSLITDMDSMVRLMRYNNFKEDPLSKCRDCDPPNNGENAISARSDLNPSNGTYPFGALKQRPHGGTDMKVLTTLMRMWLSLGNFRNYLELHAPVVIFFMCMLSLAVSFISFGVYCNVHSVRNPDITQDWNQILASIAGLKFCMLSNETDAPSLPMEDVTASPQYAKQKTTVGMSLNFSAASSNLSLLVPLTLAVSSQGQSPAYLHAKLQGWELGLKGSSGKESLNLTLLFYSQLKADPTTNGTSVETVSTFTCLRVTGPTYILPQTKRPPECPVINERNSPMNAMTTTWKKQKFPGPSECYSMKFTSDPSLTVMLSLEERALAGYHLIITSACLLFVCGVLCIHSFLPSPKSRGCQDNGRDLKEPLIES